MRASNVRAAATDRATPRRREGWMGRRKRGPGRAKLGRPPGAMGPGERPPPGVEIACVWAFRRFGLGPFDAARRALLVVRSGPISMADIEGVLRLAHTSGRAPGGGG